ncbi:MAG: hypothetical protein KAS32_08945 [Candidatus Peribacteraceae bacterium]|nr:hypothetical protein [Candidatus Peribacteraceae bacterium]
MIKFNWREYKQLEQSRAIDILVILYEAEEPLAFTNLVLKSGGSTSVVQTRVLEMGFNGLLDETREKKFGGRRLISLTELGKSVAEHLSAIDKLLTDRMERVKKGNDYFQSLSDEEKNAIINEAVSKKNKK